MLLHRERLGVASRALMEYSFGGQGRDTLMPLAIGFLGKTFGTHATASRALVERLIETERMKDHAASDMHWLAQEVGRIGDVDPDLAVKIYEAVFSHTIGPGTRTKLGHSQILPLTSDSRQDYQMAQWGLKEAYPSFLASQPKAAAIAAIKVAKAYRDTQHALQEPVDVLTVQSDAIVAAVLPDLSHIWAAQREHHRDDGQEIVNNFIDSLTTMVDESALEIVDLVVASNDLAWLWARLFSVATQRGGAVAAKLWPLAAQTPFLTLAETMKDAIDLVATIYATRSDAERIDLETSVLNVPFSQSSNPSEARRSFQQKVFATIGPADLITEAARTVATEVTSKQRVVLNNRLYKPVEAQWSIPEEFHFLQGAGVDTTLPQNVPILDAVREAEARTEGNRSVAERVGRVGALTEQLVIASADAHGHVKRYGWEVAARELESVTNDLDAARNLTSGQWSEIWDFIEKALARRSQEQPNVEIGDRTRESIAALAMNIARVDADLAARVIPLVQSFATDQAPDVREAISARLPHLYEMNPKLCWELAEAFVVNEKNAMVLVGVLDFLRYASSAEPDQVDRLSHAIASGIAAATEPGRDSLSETLGVLVFHLWVRHELPKARESLDLWTKNRDEYKRELRRGAFFLREGLTLAYETNDPTLLATSQRCQTLAFQIIDASAASLEAFSKQLRDNAEGQTGRMQEIASNDAALLDTMASQFLFAVGSTEIREGREPRTLAKPKDRIAFLQDNAATLRRIGDAGTPKTIYYLLQLLEFLMASGPAVVFDLFSHALLTGGRLHGFQFESLGADRFVKFVGHAIADNREIFEDHDRRMDLIKVLEVFVDAGWPAARRLLYRLSEALR